MRRSEKLRIDVWCLSRQALDRIISNLRKPLDMLGALSRPIAIGALGALGAIGLSSQIVPLRENQ